MRHYLEVIDQVLPLINEGEKYIIFNDGKPVDSNAGDGIDMVVDDPYDFESYGFEYSKEEKEIQRKSTMTTLITISKSLDLKIIHICDDINYINYQIEVMPRCNVKIVNLYLHIVSDAHIMLNTICHHQGYLDYLEVNSFSNSVHKHTLHHFSHHAKARIRNLYLNEKDAKNVLKVHLISMKNEVDVLDVAIANKVKVTQNANIYHHAEESNSNFVAYGIAKNGGELYFENNGTIDNGAYKSNLNQKTKGMVLDELSTVKALPALYISEDDVSANHGASVGAINEDDLYYLMSRGLTRTESEKLLINGFIEPFFRGLDEDNTTRLIRNMIERLL